MNTQKAPIVIGVTGHRNIRKQDLSLIKNSVKEQLQAVALKCPNSPVKVLSCLAEGADQVCAEVALELNMELIVALPMEISEYKNDFSKEALFNFEKLIKQAEKVFVAPEVETKGQNANRDYFYRQADIYIARHSHCVIALWDGSPAKKGGCGTSETVDMVLNHSYEHCGRKVLVNDGFVIHIFTPRDNDTSSAATVSYLGKQAEFNKSISKLDELNAAGGDPDILSIENGKKYHNMLKLLALLGTALAIAFLLYDEIMIRGMLIALMIIFVFMLLAFKLASKSNCHEKYIEYRVFAECIRVQNHVNHIGYAYEIADFLDWSRCFDTGWVYKAMQSLSIFNLIDHSEDLINDWLKEQKNYHLKAADKTIKLQKRNRSIVLIAASLSICIYVFALIFEYALAPTLQNIELIRVIIKISVGTFSAGSLFASNYYGKLSLQHVYEDHIRMAHFFEGAEEYQKQFGTDDKFVKELINEELSENSNWCSYEKENEIGLTI